MKIFNWVHRKFHQNVDNYLVCPKKEGLAPEVKKLETVTISDTEALLEHVKFVDMIDGWKDGILTIGTFGFDHPLILLDEHTEYSVNNDEKMCRGEEYSVTDEEEKVNPIVVTAFKQEFQKVLAGSNLDTSIGIHRLSTTVDDVPLLQFLESPQIKSEIETENNMMKKRTTLAELFSAESNVVTEESDSGKKQPDLGKNPVSRKKNSPSFAKKFMPSKGEDSRPIKKIQRLVTKMLKKKIHPDIEGSTSNHGKEGSIKEQSKTRMVEGISKDGTIEKISLLQDAVSQL